MTKKQHPYNDDFFRLWEREIDNVEEHVYTTNQALFDRMRAIFTLVKNSNMAIDDPAVAKYVCEIKSYELIAKKYTSCFLQVQQLIKNHENS